MGNSSKFNLWDKDLPIFEFRFMTFIDKQEYVFIFHDFNSPEIETVDFTKHYRGKDSIRAYYKYNVTAVNDYKDTAIRKGTRIQTKFPMQSFDMALSRIFQYFPMVKMKLMQAKEEKVDVKIKFIRNKFKLGIKEISIVNKGEKLYEV